MLPKPCGDCGINFMSVAGEKLCHTCLRKAKEREEKYLKEIKVMDSIKIVIECDAKTQAEIEEICINEGISFSKYFLNLHELNINCTGWHAKSIPTLEEAVHYEHGKKPKGKK